MIGTRMSWCYKSNPPGRKTGLSEIDFEYPFIAWPEPFGTKRFRVKLTKQKAKLG